jgi:hypothetical protein
VKAAALSGRHLFTKANISDCEGGNLADVGVKILLHGNSILADFQILDEGKMIQLDIYQSNLYLIAYSVGQLLHFQ